MFSINNIRVHYGMVEAIKGVSLDVKSGTIVSLVGSNGAGKSTILKTISGLIHPTTGEIWFKNKRIDRAEPSSIVQMGIAQVPEGRRIFANMTVLENLIAGAYLRKDQKKIRADIERVWEHFPVLKDRQKQKAGTLSGGEQQMLATARALMSNPELLLMDEPSLGLSPIMVNEIGKIISDIHKSGLTIILVEQNVRLALESADKIYVLETGRVVLQGTPKDLKDSKEIKQAYLGG
jgi:branched-chain amino acid transport system ATP-binding protein